MTPERLRLERGRRVLADLVEQFEDAPPNTGAFLVRGIHPRDVDDLAALLDFLEEALPPKPSRLSP